MPGLADYYERQAIQRLERQERKSRGQVRDVDYYDFLVSPTCPPSTSIYVRSGRSWNVPLAGGNMSYFPGYLYDLSDPDIWHYTGSRFEFATEYWYIPATLTLMEDSLGYPGGEGLGQDGSLGLYGTDADVVWFTGGGLEQFETAGEAEAALEAWTTSMLGQEIQVVLCSIVFRNNGTLTLQDVTWPIQEIDRVNRGRSYIYRTAGRKVYIT